MPRVNRLYNEVVSITYRYLGPASERFINRQVRSHLHKEPDSLRRADLAVLLDWISIAMNLVSGDEKLVQQYIGELQALARPSGSSEEEGGK